MRERPFVSEHHLLTSGPAPAGSRAGANGGSRKAEGEPTFASTFWPTGPRIAALSGLRCMEQTVSPTTNERIKMTTYELWRDVAGYRAGRHDNSGLRARLSGLQR